MSLQIPTSHYAEPAEEYQHRNIAQADISVRAITHGVGDRGDNRQAAEHQETDKIRQRVTGYSNQGQPGQTDQHHGDDQRALHLLLGDDPFLHTAQRSNTVGLVAAFDGIAIVVSEIGQNLQ